VEAPWDKVSSGWTEMPFPPEDGLKMRYWYVPKADHVELHVCGSFPAFGPNTIPCAAGISGNYHYTENFFGNGTSQVIELPEF
jgi:hypothetical protein